MRLISVKTENFRQYKDLEVTFPRSGEFDIHIIEASNGVGKTNLLNAINWCLYGDDRISLVFFNAMIFMKQ